MDTFIPRLTLTLSINNGGIVGADLPHPFPSYRTPDLSTFEGPPVPD